MSTSRHFDKISCIVLALTLLITVLFLNGETLGVVPASRVMGYEHRLFDYTEVHTIDLVVDDWEGFLETCTDEEYIECAAVIDGEAYKNIAVRAKGNTSLSSVKSYGNDRYSFKLEFDHFDSTNTYHGLDKLCLNNIIQDNTYMKDFLVYQMMLEYGAKAPLCSFAYITVNGEDWGLYLAVEAVEDSFLQRNYGSDHGSLYKPDSMNMGGGRGNGKEFDMNRFTENNGMPDPNEMKNNAPAENTDTINNEPPNNGHQPAPDHSGAGGFGGMMGMGSDDVKLKYIDDDPDSYSAIFDSAKTEITDTDKQRLIEALKALSEQDTSSVFVEDVIRYFVVHNFVCNGDSYTGSMIHNYYLYEDDGQLAMLPWDYNLAFGGFESNDATSTVNTPIDDPVSGGTTDDRPMIHWIFSDERYTTLYHEYFSEFITVCFDSGFVTELIDRTAELISPYVEKDPTKFCSYEEFTQGISTLREFCILRAESVNGQLDGSIPSTTEGQNSSDALTDASHIDISAMGGMHFGDGMGGNFHGHDNRDSFAQMGEQSFPRPTEPPIPEQNTDPTTFPDSGNMPVSPDSMMLPPQGSGRPGESQGNRNDPNIMPPMSDATENIPEPDSALPKNNASDVLMWLGGSVIVLAVGIIIVKLYKRS